MPVAAIPVPIPEPATRRPPHPRPTRIRTGILDQLNAEWDELRRRAIPVHWGSEPTLGSAHTFGDLEALHADSPDQVLAALLSLATTDAGAGRVVLQLMLGEAARIASRTVHHSDGTYEDHRGHVITCLWVAIRNYPAGRPAAGVFSRLALDTLRAVTPQKGGTEVSLVDVDPERIAHIPADEPRPRAADETILELLTWGVDRGHTTPDDARLVFLYHSPARADRRYRGELAASIGTSSPALRQRVSRATRRLAHAAQQALQAGDRTVTALAS